MYSILFATINSLNEDYVDSKTAGSGVNFLKFGLTDSAILFHIQQSRLLLITDDFPLAGLASKTGCDVINFNHIRDSIFGHGA